MSAATIFLTTFAQTATQLRTPQIAADWYALSLRTGLSAVMAAQWANLGYLPVEAEHEIVAGVTVQAAAARDTPQAAHGRRDGLIIF